MWPRFECDISLGRVHRPTPSRWHHPPLAGKCFEIDIGIGRLALLQVVNTGGDVATGQFDLQMGDGGFGVFNACAAPTTGGAPPMFSGPKSAFGTQYGGWTHKADCVQLPKMPQTLPSLPPNEPDLVGLCEAGFNIGCRVDGGQNPSIKSARRVVCPAALVKLTGLNRTDGGNQESHGAGTLTRMMVRACMRPGPGPRGLAVRIPCCVCSLIGCRFGCRIAASRRLGGPLTSSIQTPTTPQ